MLKVTVMASSRCQCWSTRYCSMRWESFTSLCSV